MQTNLHKDVAGTFVGDRAQQILRSCVHCGFCNATCPTYLLTNDELDGPRGRIYLIKEMLESGSANAVAQRHLDRCLTCRACETTCPSGVEYGELLELGRGFMEARQSRPLVQSLIRRWLNSVVPNVRAFRRWSTIGNWFRWLLPAKLRVHVPRQEKLSLQTQPAHQRKVLVLQGCVQRVATPAANGAFVGLLNKNGFEAIFLDAEGCCGSLNLHLGEHEQALAQMRRNIDALTEVLEERDDVDTVVSTASGCGVTYKDYARLLEHDPEYSAKAAQLVRKIRDAAEFVASENLTGQKLPGVETVAWQAPCSLQHGQKINGVVERLLSAAGYQLLSVPDAHLCCGSAGTYSLLQPELSESLRDRKLEALQTHKPDVIATANVGCQTHLATESRVPVLHWLQLLS